jgi:hypothetical protein
MVEPESLLVLAVVLLAVLLVEIAVSGCYKGVYYR